MKLIARTLAIVLGCCTAQLAAAQTYPDRRITFVVPYAAGGAGDASARMLANKLSEAWGQPVVVENKPGGGGVVGNDYVAKAPADGYTMLLGTTQIIQAPALIKKLPYDVFKDLTPVSQIALSSIVLVVPAQQPYKSVKDLIDAAKNGSKLTYGSFGNGTTPHLYGELLNKRAGVDMTHVPYRGGSPLLNDLIGNQINAGFIDLTTSRPQIEAGGLRALAVGGEKRRSVLPDTPTLSELGYQGFEPEGWVGVFVPAGVPKAIVDKLSAELDRITKSADGIAKLESLGMIPIGGTAEEFAAVLKKDAVRWAEVTSVAGVERE